MSYMTRALQSRDPRFARILGKLGHKVPETAEEAHKEPVDDDLRELRAQYQEVVGKRPYHGWDAETLLEKIIEAEEAQS